MIWVHYAEKILFPFFPVSFLRWQESISPLALKVRILVLDIPWIPAIAGTTPGGVSYSCTLR